MLLAAPARFAGAGGSGRVLSAPAVLLGDVVAVDIELNVNVLCPDHFDVCMKYVRAEVAAPRTVSQNLWRRTPAYPAAFNPS
jgi:hypothetical protein